MRNKKRFNLPPSKNKERGEKGIGKGEDKRQGNRELGSGV
jgi:hypothetical protein